MEDARRSFILSITLGFTLLLIFPSLVYIPILTIHTPYQKNPLILARTERRASEQAMDVAWGPSVRPSCYLLSLSPSLLVIFQRFFFPFLLASSKSSLFFSLSLQEQLVAFFLPLSAFIESSVERTNWERVLTRTMKGTNERSQNPSGSSEGDFSKGLRIKRAIKTISRNANNKIFLCNEGGRRQRWIFGLSDFAGTVKIRTRV